MSISSMLGEDPSKTREPSAPTLINATPPNYILPPSTPQAAAGSPTNPLYGNPARYQGSIEAQDSMPASSKRFQSYSAGTPQSTRTSANPDSPMGSHIGYIPGDNPSQISPRSDHGPSQDWRGRPDMHSNAGMFLDRPSSQPSGVPFPMQALNKNSFEINAKQSDISRNQSMRTETALGRDPALSSSTDPPRPQSQISGPHISQHAEQDVGRRSPVDDRMPASIYPFLSSSSVFSEPTNTAPRPQNNSGRLTEQKAKGIHKGPWGAEAPRRIREERLGGASAQPRAPASESRPRFSDALDDRQQQHDEVNIAPRAMEMQRSQSLDKAFQQTRAGEDGHRNSLSLVLDQNRRAGRASPLPQAVQGAQGQTNGPSRDPSIKNEFSKMFAGIGSGVSSSGLAGSGTSTPFPPQSPKQGESEQRLPLGTRNELGEISKSRNGSRMGNKRNRKVKDDNAKEADWGPRGDTRQGVKRVRHHHHAPGHHHHHHYRMDEQRGTPIRVIGDPAATNHHHHHHPDGTIHYHTHSKPTSTTVPSRPLPPPRLPKTIINNASLFATVSHLPRRHLGSVLYAPNLEPPTSPLSLSSNLPFTTGQYTIPPCTGKENCTLTVRTPRFYLTAPEREAICQRRAVWGTDVYTDDSDPLAAAMHSGWIRGEWGPGVSVSMLEIEPGGETASDAKQAVFTSRPRWPLLPPKGKDLHLILLILPPLKGYASTVAHGIKSQSWGKDHDGMSFKVERISWVDEGVGAGEERSGKAKKARIKGLMQSAVGNMPAVKVSLGKSTLKEVSATA
ncbi:MAG: hypothetical protein Q9163_004067 [Psora crenata]